MGRTGELPLINLQEQVDEWITNHGVRYFNELTNMAMLTEEVGEVARIMARRYGEQSEKDSDRDKDLGSELADVLFVVLCLANQTNTDLQQAWTQRMEEKTKRDKDRHRNNPKLR
ncbi:MAG: nucleotide pyrophosphohydrolase [Flavobacteriales bacterium]|nr:nucleotide pyrophosphohydrolase [Flavobacteriales bacterium]